MALGGHWCLHWWWCQGRNRRIRLYRNDVGCFKSVCIFFHYMNTILKHKWHVMDSQDICPYQWLRTQFLLFYWWSFIVASFIFKSSAKIGKYPQILKPILDFHLLVCFPTSFFLKWPLYYLWCISVTMIYIILDTNLFKGTWYTLIFYVLSDIFNKRICIKNLNYSFFDKVKSKWKNATWWQSWNWKC